MEDYEIEACFDTDTQIPIKTRLMVRAEGIDNATNAAWVFVLGRIHNLKDINPVLMWLTVRGYVIGEYDPRTNTLTQSYPTFKVFEWKHDQLGAQEEMERWIKEALK